MRKILRKTMGWCMALCVMTIWAFPASRQLYFLPEHISLDPGEKLSMQLDFPITATIGNDQIAEARTVTTGNPVFSAAEVQVTAQQAGQTELTLSILGMPVRRMHVEVGQERCVIPGGQSIGVKLDVKGVLIVSCGEVIDPEGISHEPAEKAGLKSGEMIIDVNGIAVKNAKHLTELVNESTGNVINLTVENGQKIRSVSIKPVTDRQDGINRLGIWVRDSTAGIGTLSFIDPETLAFGALGHAIADLDTGKILPVEDGDIYRSHIVSVQQGSLGIPGELKGGFSGDDKPIGKIRDNQKRGIYGYLYAIPEERCETIPLGRYEDMYLGDAQILTTVDDQGIQTYDVKILRLYPNSKASDKGIVLQITDPNLLEKTGGIVQGMSGSPIIQDGKLVGAVTHVLVNDPTRGYGIFIENMLEAAE